MHIGFEVTPDAWITNLYPSDTNFIMLFSLPERMASIRWPTSALIKSFQLFLWRYVIQGVWGCGGPSSWSCVNLTRICERDELKNDDASFASSVAYEKRVCHGDNFTGVIPLIVLVGGGRCLLLLLLLLSMLFRHVMVSRICCCMVWNVVVAVCGFLDIMISM